ncbi:uncharacterized protein LOC126601691 [Malus sylvestris]|uniref:uncharacterized protein LOC126601691 n=1 Tax=Malus sylvestris TaxID=3752 RepID=UPI0021AC9E2E|nr:uncharacterized protein LOC126601691 [Malus sylvestris]
MMMKVACSLMLDKCVINHLWGHAVLAAVYLINRVPNRVLVFQTPLDMLQKHVYLVSVSKLPPNMFGCIAYVHVYLISGVNLMHVLSNVYLLELGTEPIMLRDTDQSAIDSDWSPIILETISTDNRSDVPNELSVSMSDELPSDDRLPAFGMSNELLDDGSSNDDSFNSLVQDGDIHELHDALSDLKWVNAMKVEMEVLENNSTWDLISLPNGKKVVGCRWVFTIKHKTDGSIDWYKARLVAKGYTQTYGVDY